MRSRFLSAALAGTLALGAGMAHADTHATASFSQIQFTLYDLAPTDGVPASVSFSSYLGSYAFTLAFGSAGTGPQADSRSVMLGGPVSTGSTFDTKTSGTAAFSGDIWAGTGLATAGADAGPAGFSQGLGETFLNFDGAGSFTLSAHTLLEITGFADVRAWSTDPLAYEHAGADVMMSLSGGSGGSRQSSDASLAVATYSGMAHDSGNLSVSFLNSGGSDLTGLFSMRTDASAWYSGTSAVPEPGSMAMLLAGAGVLLVGARRRGTR